MYSARQKSEMHEQFWVAFGKYMSPVLSASEGKISWINYHTGIRGVFFRMYVTGSEACLAVEIEMKDPISRKECFMRFHALKENLEFSLNEKWHWEEEAVNANGKAVSRIYKKLEPANIYSREDWPAIISFLKPRLVALDAFWTENADFFESFR